MLSGVWLLKKTQYENLANSNFWGGHAIVCCVSV